MVESYSLQLSTSSPEYLALKKSYIPAIETVKLDPGSICDALFAKWNIPDSVTNYIRNDSKLVKDKARKLIDHVIDKIKSTPNVFHDFIEAITKIPYCCNLVRILKECYQSVKNSNEGECSTFSPSQGDHSDRNIAGDESLHANAFVCPYCQKCSLMQYLSDEGCPEKSGKTLFPYLDTKRLSKQERMVLEDTLVIAAKDLIKLFAQTDNYIAQNLGANVTQVKNFALDLVKEFQCEENEAELRKATTIPEIILSLQPYKSFLNYDIIESIVDEFGSPEIKKKMQDYVTAFSNFCKRSAFELPISVFSKKLDMEEVLLSVKVRKKDLVSLGDIISVRKKMASILKVRTWAFQLCSIEDGCVCVRFLVPFMVISKIHPLSPAKKRALSKANISNK